MMMPTLRALRRLHRADDGGAMMMAITLLFLIGLLGGAVAMSGMLSSHVSKNRTDRAIGLAPADSAMAVYLTALQNLTADETKGYFLTRQDLESLKRPGDTVIANGSISAVGPVDSSVPAQYRYTMRQAETAEQPGAHGFWQIYMIHQPDFVRQTHLVVYFRAWMGDAAGRSASRTRVVRVEYRPGRFADFQLLTDGPIKFVGGGIINGPVHSNGFENGITIPRNANERVWNEGPVSCVGRSHITTGNGRVNMPGSCSREENTQRIINFLRVEDSFERMAADCGRGIVHCFTRPGTYRVRLNGNRAQVSGPQGGSVPLTGPKVLYFEDDVQVSGRARGRVTIAARDPQGQRGAGNIIVTGSTTTDAGFDANGTGRDPNQSLGLMAQGHVIAYPCGVSQIHAAILAESGALTLPPGMTTDAEQRDLVSSAYCGSRQLSIAGSIAGHRAPVLSWTWGSFRIGWDNRRYLWDRNLYFNPPPYFPQTDTWQVKQWSDANSDCLRGAGRSNPSCR